MRRKDAPNTIPQARLEVTAKMDGDRVDFNLEVTYTPEPKLDEEVPLCHQVVKLFHDACAGIEKKLDTANNKEIAKEQACNNSVT